MRIERQAYRKYLLDIVIALVIVALAGGLRIWPLDLLGARLPYLTFYPAVVLAAVLGGLVPGLLTTLGALAFLYFLYPGKALFIQDYADVVGLLVFLFNGAVIAVIGEYARRARQTRDRAEIRVQQFSTALDHISAYIYIKDRQHRYTYANKHTLELFKCTAESLIGSEDSRFFPPQTVARLCEVDTRVMEKGEHTAEEIVVPLPGGDARIYWEVKAPIYDDRNPGRVIGLCGISTDVTQQKQKEAELQESVGRFRATFDAAAIGMALVSLEGRFMEVNDALCDIVGYGSAELTSKTFQDITHADDLQADLALVQEMLDDKRDQYHIEKRYIHRDGHVIWVLLSVAKVADSVGRLLYFIAQIQDVNQQKALIEALKVQARKDVLTGLNNRRHFLELCETEMQRSVRYGTPVSMLMLDIDHFKRINDAHGHKAGDLVLVQLAHIMKETLRSVDIVGRYGGEEFAILLPETDHRKAMEVAERLRLDIAAAAIVLEVGMPLKITVSIGVASAHGQETNVDILLNAADQALYRAKNGGRNQVMLADTGS